MKKEQTILFCLGAFLVIGSLVDIGTMDGYYVAATVAFFLLCVAYVEWCGRL